MAATSNSLVLTQDLRAVAQDYKRDSNNKHKWQLGEAFGSGRAASHPKPRKPEPKYASSRNDFKRLYLNHCPRRKVLKVHASKAVHRQGIVSDRHEVATDSSCDEDVEAPDNAPIPDAEVTYSFDAQRGPSQGSQILGHALEKAVAKFESIATEKLVRDEYEILDSDGEPVATKTGKKFHKADNASVEEDDYEFV
jgi:hypothetical protein